MRRREGGFLTLVWEGIGKRGGSKTRTGVRRKGRWVLTLEWEGEKRGEVLGKIKRENNLDR